MIEARVLGLQHFLEMTLASPQYASCPELEDFLEREKNMPPFGLDIDLLEPHDAAGDAPAASPDGSIEGARQAQLKALVDSAAQAFISVSQEPPALDPSYLTERSAAYAATLRPSEGPLAASVLSLDPPSQPAEQSAPLPSSVEAALATLVAEPDMDPADVSLAKATAAAVGSALGSISVQGHHEVLVTVG